MPWTRLDDRFHTNPKILGLTHQAFRLYVVALNWSVSELTDGRIPLFLPPMILPLERDRARSQIVAELENQALWKPDADGWEIHDFANYQETSSKVQERRSKWAVEKRGQRQVSATDKSPDKTADSTPDSNPDPVRTRVPIPIPSSEAKASTEREDLFKAFYEFWTGRKYQPKQKMPSIERGRINKAVEEAMGAGITAAEIRARGKVYKEMWRDLEVSPQALLGNWSKFDRSKDVQEPCSICDSRRIVGFTKDGEVVKVDDPRAVVNDRCVCVAK